MATMRGADDPTAGSVVRLCCSAELKIEPSAAMPAAMPIWRNVELTPDAIPAFCGGDTASAVGDRGGGGHSSPYHRGTDPGRYGWDSAVSCCPPPLRLPTT